MALNKVIHMHLRYDVRDHAKLKEAKERRKKKMGLTKLTWEDVLFLAMMRL